MQNSWRQLFLPCRCLQTRTEVVAPRRKMGRKQWVVSRSLCFYRLFLLGDIPAAERREALATRIREYSPFQETGRYVAWQDHAAMVWIWDEAARRQMAQTTGMAGTRVIPEPLLWDRPVTDGLRAVRCLEGVEVQMWKKKVLTVSRWWPDEPSVEAWSRFLLGLDHDPAEPFPSAMDLLLRDRPWGGEPTGGSMVDLRHEKRYVCLALMAFAFFLIWRTTDMVHLMRAKTTLTDRIATLNQEVEPLIDARTQALDYRQRAERLLSLASYPSQMELMAAVAQNFPSPSVALLEWHYSRGQLAVVLRGDNLNPGYFVGVYEESPFFIEVIAERGQNPELLNVRMKVKPQGIH